LAEKSFEYVIDTAVENNFDCVEIMCWPKGKAERRYAGVTHIDIDSLGVKEITYIKDYCSNKNIQISALGYYPNPLDSDIDKRKFFINHLKKIIVAAPKLGVDTVTTFIGRDPVRTIAESLVDFKSVWPDIIKFAESNGVKIAIENCPMLFSWDEWPGGKNLASTPKVWDAMFSIIDSNSFGLNYDPSHFVWQHMDYIKPIYDYQEKLFHVHIKDHKVDPYRMNVTGIMVPPLEYSSPKLPGLGDVDWGKFISALTDIGYDGAVCIEVEDKAFENTLNDRINALKQSRNFIKQFLI
jgi:sugar phosphate isomerase/epimerase